MKQVVNHITYSLDIYKQNDRSVIYNVGERKMLIITDEEFKQIEEDTKKDNNINESSIGRINNPNCMCYLLFL